MTLKDRIAQSLYVLGSLGAVLGLVMIAGAPFDKGVLEDLPLIASLSLGSYGAGWGLRWIINGTSTSVLDYARK
ncbi:hypothetical protein [Aphanothece microscopica]|uniref:hypothetical protein n=1 Tax=Aphanothece microscopica TaxID=1049561 RepID=UPI003984A692